MNQARTSTYVERTDLSTTVHICEGPAQLAEHAAAHIAAAARRAVAERGRFTLCLSGGDTPQDTYARLATAPDGAIPWGDVHVFWGDERCIPLDRPDNHFAMATKLLLSRVPIPPGNIHRARGEAADPVGGARQYESELRAFFAEQESAFPVFDLVLLGMGEDGHVASLFPGSVGWQERESWVVDHYVVKRGERVRRLTLTMPVLTAAREIIVLVSGELKADALAAVLEGTADVPASELAAAASDLHWIVDRDAAARLTHSATSGGYALR